MPKMDGTGPMGQGTMTGRGMGNCGGGTRHSCCGRMQGLASRFGGFFRSSKNRLQALDEEEKMLVDELEALRAEKEALAEQK
ncbi:MAG TPA: DUF5320 domain-containing protein [Patescibacteria group bacterium]|nr:DUF5320 domain-containing protein [Patescibacteria group bacterium]